ncbi:hypothetical protein [uncultured Sphingomonas sp.]|uniref:hypothetical protein n=1 Tax=uncultured Sphingomonas sp. TaxID=158754 RepID=UPI0025F7C19D|nr:hypothetical protein [uncultured Sphingomonas sp.]
MRLVFAAILALAAATPAFAGPADPASIGCVGQKLDAAVKAQLAVNVERNLANPGQRPSYDPAVTRGLNDATTACANERGWSGAAASASGVYALAEVGMPVARRVVQAKGFDPAALDQQFAALPEEVRRAPLTPKATQDLIRAAVTDEAQQTRANAQLLAQYFAFLNTLEYAVADFSR